jgi:hypothetical protein
LLGAAAPLHEHRGGVVAQGPFAAFDDRFAQPTQGFWGGESARGLALDELAQPFDGEELAGGPARLGQPVGVAATARFDLARSAFGV